MQDVLLPIETMNRELEGSLLVGIHLANRGHRVFFGSVRRINKLALLLENGVYIGTHAFIKRNRERIYKKMKQRGFALLYLHTEGAVYPGLEDGWKNAMDWYIRPEESANDLASDDWHCTWGSFQADYYRERAPEGLRSRIVVTGNPRFDLYKERYRAYFAEEAKQIKAQHGPFVLVNTNLNCANNSRGHENTFSPDLGYRVNEPVARMTLVDSFDRNMRSMGAMVHLVHRLSLEFPQLNFVVRPHPSEDAQYYRIAFNGVPNIKIIHSGPVGAWLAAAEALIHDGCTTAIEARLMGCPVLSSGLAGNAKSGIVMADELGILCTTQADVIRYLRMLGGAGIPLVPLEKKLSAVRLMHNFTADSLGALTEVVESSLKERPRSESTIPLRRVALHENLQSLRDAPRRFGVRTRDAVALKAQHQKFYGLANAMVWERFDRLKAVSSAHVALRLLSADVAVLTPAA